MPVIQCPYCCGNVSYKAQVCVHCGYPLERQETKAIFKASGDVIGLINSYKIMDENQNVIAKLKPGDTYEEILGENVTKKYYVKLTGSFSSPKLITGEQFNDNAIFFDNPAYVGGVKRFYKLFNVEDGDMRRSFELNICDGICFSRLRTLYRMMRNIYDVE